MMNTPATDGIAWPSGDSRDERLQTDNGRDDAAPSGPQTQMSARIATHGGVQFAPSHPPAHTSPASPPLLRPRMETTLGRLSSAMSRAKRKMTASRASTVLSRSIEINTALFHSARHGYPRDPADFKQGSVTDGDLRQGTDDTAAHVITRQRLQAQVHAQAILNVSPLDASPPTAATAHASAASFPATDITTTHRPSPDRKMDRLAKNAHAHAIQSEWVDGVSEKQKTRRAKSFALTLHPTRLVSALQHAIHPMRTEARESNVGNVASDNGVIGLYPVGPLPDRTPASAIGALRDAAAWRRWIENALPAQARAQTHNVPPGHAGAAAVQLPSLDQLRADRAATEHVHRALRGLGPAVSPAARESGVLVVQSLHRLGVMHAEQAVPILDAVCQLDFTQPDRMHADTPEAVHAWRLARNMARTAPGFDALMRLRGERRPRNALGDLVDVPPEHAHRREAQRMMLQVAAALEPDDASPMRAYESESRVTADGARAAYPGSVTGRIALESRLDPSPAAVIARHRAPAIGDPARPNVRQWRSAPLAWRSGAAALEMLRAQGDASRLHADAIGDFFAWQQGFRKDGPGSDYAFMRARLHKFTAKTIPRVAQSQTRNYLPRLFGKRRSPLSALVRFGTQGVPRKTFKAEHQAMRDGIDAAVAALPPSVRTEAADVLPTMTPDDALAVLTDWLHRAGPHASPAFQAALTHAQKLAHPGEVDAPPVPIGRAHRTAHSGVANGDARVTVNDVQMLTGDDPVSLARRTLQAVARALPSSSRLRLGDGNRIGVSTRGLSANVSTALGLAGIPIAPRLDLRASRQREAVVEIARNTQGVDVFVGTADTLSAHSGAGVLLGYDIDVGLARFRAGLTLQGVPYSDARQRPRGVMLRVARRVAGNGGSYSDARMLEKAEQIVSHLFDESLRLNGQLPLATVTSREDRTATPAPVAGTAHVIFPNGSTRTVLRRHRDAQAERDLAEGKDARGSWNRLARCFIDDPDISIGWMDGRNGQQKHGVSADAGPSFRLFGPASWMRLGVNAGLAYEHTSRRWLDGDEHSGRMQVTQHRVGRGHRLIGRLGGTIGGTSEAGDGSGAVSVGVVSLDAPSINVAFKDRSRQAKVQRVRENGRLVSRACLVDLEYTDAHAYCRAMQAQRPRWIAFYANQAPLGTSAAAAHEQATRRFVQHLADAMANRMPNQTYFHRWRLRRDKAEEIDGLSALATNALVEATIIEKATRRAPNGRLQRPGPPDPRLLAARAAHDAFQAEIDKIADDPESWIPVEEKGKERSRQARSPGVNFAVQWNTTTSAVGEREIFSEALSFATMERLDRTARRGRQARTHGG
ncbi:hypothetical protein ACQUFY_02280 [Robbsia andropogonis]|uniref:hypothetical protein n=1 Tax=Robbsia andropogonis TaxID=28092 RepID=UPI003D1DA231